KSGITGIEKAVKDGNVRLGVRVEPAFQEKVEKMQPVTITLFFDPSDNRSLISMGVLQNQLNMLNQQLLGERLGKLGIQQQSLTPIEIKEINLSTDEQMAGSFMSLIIPLLLLMAVATGGMPAAIDLVAGEKERGTLEALLTTPASSKAVLVAKLIVVSTMGCLSAIASLGAFAFTMKTDAFQKFTTTGEGGNAGGPLNFDFFTGQNIFYILLIMILLGIMFAGVQLALSTVAKGFKEASTYMSPLVIVAMIPAYLLMQTGAKELEIYHFIVPIVNVIAIFKEFIYGIFNLGHIGMVIGSTIVYVGIAVGIATYLFRKESFVFKH
ncbi:MAG TPA: ABC transporter permease, partial [Paenibacillaceae bacterium]|nr:ABC transporter permease [Paenibacillaceae bacterium]